MILKGLLVESPKVAAAVSSSSSSTKGSLMRLALGCHKNQACHEASSNTRCTAKQQNTWADSAAKPKALNWLLCCSYLFLVSSKGSSWIIWLDVVSSWWSLQDFAGPRVLFCVSSFYTALGAYLDHTSKIQKGETLHISWNSFMDPGSLRGKKQLGVNLRLLKIGR